MRIEVWEDIYICVYGFSLLSETHTPSYAHILNYVQSSTHTRMYYTCLLKMHALMCAPPIDMLRQHESSISEVGNVIFLFIFRTLLSDVFVIL